MYRKVSKLVEMYTHKQMTMDLQLLLSKDPEFLDQREIPTDPYTLNLMSLGLRRRYYNLSYLSDIKRALLLLEVARKKAAVASLDWLSSVRNLARAYYLYYNETSNLCYLQQTIRLSEQLIEHTNTQSPDLVQSLHHLASYLIIRGRRTKNPHDIRRAYNAWKECIQSNPESSQDRNTYISRIFLCLLASQQFEDEVVNLEEGIDALNLLLGKNSIEESEFPTMIVILAESLMKSYFQSRRLSDLNTIIHCWEQAIQGTSPHAVYLSDLNSMLSISFLVRFLLLKNDEDLKKAVDRQEEALYLCEPATLKYIQNLHNLGQTLMIRYKHLCSMADLNHAIEMFERGFAALPASSPLKPTFQESLTAALYQRYIRIANVADLKHIQQLEAQQ